MLGASVTAVCPAGGHTGHLLTRLVGEAGVPLQQIEIAEPTRESFTIDERSNGKQYRFVLPGPRLKFAEQAQCLDELRSAGASANPGH